MTIIDQLKRGAGIAINRYKSNKFIAYFQAGTTTNASTVELRKLYDTVLSYPGVVGLAISTRPDVLSSEVLDLIEEYSKKTFLWVELGAQSMLNKSLMWIKRGHSAEDFKTSVEKLKERNINTVGHIIFGLPAETPEETLYSFKEFINTGIDGFKIHMLHVIKNTVLEKIYLKENFKLLSMDEYVNLVRSALEMIDRELVVHRVTSEADSSKLIAPLWILDKNKVYKRILE
jgi:hypothetical protein